MALKFNCEHCGIELTEFNMEKGSKVYCTNCKKMTIIPQNAREVNLEVKNGEIKEEDESYAFAGLIGGVVFLMGLIVVFVGVVNFIDKTNFREGVVMQSAVSK